MNANRIHAEGAGRSDRESIGGRAEMSRQGKVQSTQQGVVPVAGKQGVWMAHNLLRRRRSSSRSSWRGVTSARWSGRGANLIGGGLVSAG